MSIHPNFPHVEEEKKESVHTTQEQSNTVARGGGLLHLADVEKIRKKCLCRAYGGESVAPHALI